MILQGLVGPSVNTDGSYPAQRMGKLGDVIASELHGRFYEQVSRGNVFSTGSSITALSANTISLTATTTPIVGVYNPVTSGVNLVILQAMCYAMANTVTTPVGPGVLVWASSINNSAITTGSSPFNRRTMAYTGSQAKGFPGGVALTGLTNNLVVFEAGDFSTITPVTYGTVANTAIIPGFGGVQNFDGSLFVPPGGVLALLNTTSSTTFSATSRLLWEEVPV